MKKYIVLVFAFIVVKTCWSQSTNSDNKYAIKVYNLTSYEEFTLTKTRKDTPSFSTQNSATTLQIFHPTIALQWQSNSKNYHEIELISLMLRNIESKIEDIDYTTNNTQPVFASKFTTASISIRYEYIYNLNKKRDKAYMTSLGFGLNPYFTQNNYSTSITTIFPISEKIVGLKGFIYKSL